MKYYTHLEDYVYDLYKSIGILRPEDLDMHYIARKLGVEIVYGSYTFRLDNEIILVEGEKCEEWMEFGHELCHYLRHSGSQLNMYPLFIELQEWQANNFAYHFCVPTFMLEKVKMPKWKSDAIQLLVETFNVNHQFAEKRLDMWHRKEVFLMKYAMPLNM